MSSRRWLPWRRRPAASPPAALRCVELVELVTEYLEDALTPADRARFDAHVSGCDHCSTYLDQMRITLSLVGHMEPDELAPEMERELLDAFKNWKAGEA
jgi:anti-sigma factor RsiW